MLDEYDKHAVLDFMGQPVDAYHYEVELNMHYMICQRNLVQ